MYPIPNWPNEPVKTMNELRRGVLKGDMTEPADLNLDDLLRSSDEFPIEFPIDSVRCKSLKNAVSPTTLTKHINSVYPVLHESVVGLYVDFILHKRKLGTSHERELYKDMSFLEFVDRLLKKRAAVFMGRNDDYLLLNGSKGRSRWETIGGEDQSDDLAIADNLSYDEIKLSAFLSVSSYSYFINDGDRRNKGVVAKNRQHIQEEGVVVGVIGARMKKKYRMEYQEMIISKDQNHGGHGFGTTFAPTIPSIFSGFYGKPSWDYKTFLLSPDLKKPGHFTEISKGVYFDNVTFARRIALSIDTLLLEANQRARERKMDAYVHVVGFGLGVWKCSVHQEDIFMETFQKRLE